MAVANDYINFYIGEPTAEGTDGTLMSVGNDGSNPLTITVNASTNESKIVKVAIRCVTGYQTESDTHIFFRGSNYEKWSISKTPEGTFGPSLTIDDTINDRNYIFYVKGIATSGELPDIDTTTSLVVQTNVRQILS